MASRVEIKRILPMIAVFYTERAHDLTAEVPSGLPEWHKVALGLVLDRSDEELLLLQVQDVGQETPMIEPLRIRVDHIVHARDVHLGPIYTFPSGNWTCGRHF
jgi:hypothetical protein